MAIKDFFDPNTENMKSQGFKPNFFIKLLRLISNIIIFILRLNGKNRWSNEFIQLLDPHLMLNFVDKTTNLKHKLWFRTGHGRLFWRSRYSYELEKDTIQWIESFNKDEIFYDIGANIGFYSLIASKFKNCVSFAFEPDLMNARILYENVIKNNLSELISVYPVALSNLNYNAKLYLKTVSYGDALHNLDSVSDNLKNKNEGFVTIPALKLDTLINEMNLPQPTKIKIDVDGIEDKIFEGSINTLKKCKEVLIECDEETQNLKYFSRKFTQIGYNMAWKGKCHNNYSGTFNVLFRKNK